MKLSKRLEAIMNSIPNSEILVDVGTDHALVPIEAIKRGITKKVIASDVKIGPINVALYNIKKHQIIDRIETRVGYGLENIVDSELETVVIAGMGGILISEILQKDLDKAKMIKNLIIQPMNSAEVIRKWLYNNSFDIIDENLVKEDKRVYSIIEARFDNVIRSTNRLNCYISARLIEKNDAHLKDYINWIINVNEKKIESIKRSKNSIEKLKEIIILVDDLKKVSQKVM